LQTTITANEIYAPTACPPGACPTDCVAVTAGRGGRQVQYFVITG